MMIPRANKIALTLIPALAAFLVLQACGAGGNANAQEADADPIEGVWESVVTVRDCSTLTPGVRFAGAQVLHRGGTMSDTNASPTATRGPGFGTWTRSGATYTVQFRFYTYNAIAVSGVNRVTRTFTLDPTGRIANSVNTIQSFDLSGALVNSSCATDVSTKVL